MVYRLWPIAVVLAALLAACRGGGGGDGDADADTDMDADAEGDGPACDRDEDGHESLDCGGDDCDDGDPEVHPGAADAPWFMEVVEVAPDGSAVDFVVGPDGVRHVLLDRGLYGTHSLRDDGSGWTMETVQTEITNLRGADLAIGPDGSAHVLLAGQEPGELRYATNAGGSWTTETVDAPYRVLSAAVGVAADGTVHAAWDDRDSFAAWHATRAGGSWQTEAIPEARSVGLAMALDAEGAAHLAIVTAGMAPSLPQHWTNGSGAWAVEATGSGEQSGPSGAPSIAIGQDGTVHLAWLVGGGSSLVRYSSNAGGTFADEDVGPAGGPWLALDADGAPRVGASTRSPSDAVFYAWRGPGGWQVDRVAAGYGGLLGFDRDGVANLVHANLTTRTLRVAHYEPADGVDDDCDGIADGRSGLDPSLEPVGLAAGEAAELCDWALGLQGGEGASVPCGESTVTVGTVADCVAARGFCPTVEAFELCMLAVGSDPCELVRGLPAACEPCGPGLDPALTLSALGQADWQAWCEWSVSTQGGGGFTTTCPDGAVTVATVESCVTGSSAGFATCSATVAEANGCTLAMAQDPCTGMDAAECAALLACLFGG